MEVKDPNTHLREGQNTNRRLGYAKEFHSMIKEHPGILKTALELAQKAEDEYNPPNVIVQDTIEFQWNPEIEDFESIRYDDQDTERLTYKQWLPNGRGVLLAPGATLRDDTTGLEVTALAKTKREFAGGPLGTGATFRIDKSAYFKMKLGDKTFFVKKSTHTNNPGFYEFRNTKHVSSSLSSMRDIAVVEAQLGYSDDHQSWFVSDWKDLQDEGFFPIDAWKLTGVPNDDYGRRPKEEIDWVEASHEERSNKYEVIKNIRTKNAAIETEIRNRLKEAGINIHDLDMNLFYNPASGKYFLLDVTTEDRGSGINQQFEVGD